MKKAAPATQPTPTVLLFLKAPRLGTVKTRLAASVGSEAALSIYRSLAERQIERLPPNWPLIIYFTPAEALPEMQRWLGGTHAYRAQAVGDLGERLSAAVQDAFATGAQSVICIGADCPALDTACLQSAEKALLDGFDVVFGPAKDGGYYLIGMNQAHTDLFRAIPWSTEHTLAASLQKADQLRLHTKLLEPLDDLDTEDDLHRARKDGHFGEVFPE